MTFNGATAVILRYFSNFGRFGSIYGYKFNHEDVIGVPSPTKM